MSFRNGGQIPHIDKLVFAIDAKSPRSNVSGSTLVMDLSGNNIVGTVSTGGVTDIKFDSASIGGFHFNESDKIDFDSTIALTNAVGWTAHIWYLSTQSVNNLGYLFTSATSGPANMALHVTSSYMSFYHYSGGWQTEVGTTAINDGTWHLLTWVQHTDSTMDMYVDGVIDVSGIDSGFGGGSTALTRMGKQWGSGNGINGGNIGSVYCYNGISKTADQVLEFYNATKGRFD